MPAKKPVADRLKSVNPTAGTHIPTTIKNPQRVASRRSELIEVATKMFLERGFHNTSIRDIARACTFNVASLYMYVSSKEDILYLVAQDLMRNITDRLAQTKLDPTSPERSLAIGFAGYCAIANDFRRPIRLLYREVQFLPPRSRDDVIATVSSVIKYFEDIITSGIETGVFRDKHARLAGLDVMMLAHMIALHTREIRAMGDLDAYVRHQLAFILSGLLAGPRSKAKPQPRKGARPRRKTASGS